MKKYLSFIFILLFAFADYTFAIDFNDITINEKLFQELKTKAKSENKLIFIYFSSSFCGPCKKMEKYILPNDSINTFYEDKFILAKVHVNLKNIKKCKVLKDYEINSFPHFLILNFNGKIIHKAIGYHDIDSFIELGNQALSENDNFMSWKKRIRNGELDYGLITNYLRSINPHSLEAKEILKGYYNTQPSDLLSSSQNWELTCNYITDQHSIPFCHLINNINLYKKKHGEFDVNTKLFDVYFDSIGGLYDLNPIDQKIQDNINNSDIEMAKVALTFKSLLLTIFSENPDLGKFVREADCLVSKYYKYLNSGTIQIWTEKITEYAEKNNDKKALELAQKWTSIIRQNKDSI
ncbi:thiol reductase thioredoxin [Aureibacter tunicatorum]|nr:thiol reductase thioredoxin [Aureibacter tunicatorum]